MTEWAARDYHEQSQLQRTLADEHLARLTLRGDERVLDVGCGDGAVTVRVAERVPAGSVLGVDPSRDMVAYAERHYGGPKLRFEVGDARRLPYRAEFDLAVSFNALHWVPEQAEALRSIRTTLKPDGQTFLVLVPEGARRSIEDVLQETTGDPRWAARFEGFPRPYAHLTPEAYRALAERCGFRVDSIRVSDHAWDFGSRQAFLDFSHATCVAWTGRLPEGERPAFLSAALDRYRAVAAETPAEADTFKFYQMEVRLSAA